MVFLKNLISNGPFFRRCRVASLSFIIMSYMFTKLAKNTIFLKIVVKHHHKLIKFYLNSWKIYSI